MPSSDTSASTDDPLATRSVREVILELSQTEDALREWRTRTGRREVPVLDVHTLLARQRELVDELRHLSGTVDLTDLDADADPAVGAERREPPQVAS
jgi:hypothetical protein